MSDIDFIKKENQELNDLEKTFTPNQQVQYKEEVEYIKYLLKILADKEKKPETPENKKEEKKTKKEAEKAIGDLINNYSFKKATDITHEELSPEELLDGRLVKVSDKYYKNKGIDSENYMEQNDISPDWKINEELSTDKGVVVYNEKTGKAKVVFRGTDKTNIGDLQADAKIYFGTEGNDPHFTEGREQMRNAIDTYGLENVSTAGFSLGGNKSWLFGNEFGVPSRSFNPFIGKTIVNQAENYRPNIEHNIVRTQDDLPSVQSQYIEGKNGTKITVVSTRGGALEALNPYKAHESNNFISNEGRSKTGNDGLQLKSQQLAEHAYKHGELQTLHNMLKVNKKYNVKNLGDLNETDYMDRLNTIDNKLNERSKINTETRTDRLEAKTKARTQSLNPDDFEIRSNDFSGGLFPPPESKKPTTNFQTELENNAFKFRKPHLPKKDLPKNVADKIRNSDDAERFLKDYRSDGTHIDEPPLTEQPIRIRNSTKSNMVKQRLQNVKQEALEMKQRLQKLKSLQPKSKAKLLGLRNKTKAEPTPESRTLQNQTENLENELVESGTYTEPSGFTKYANDNGLDADSNHQKSLWEASGGKLTNEEKNSMTEDTEGLLNSDNDIENFVEGTPTERNQILEEHSITHENMTTELNNMDNSGIRSVKSYGTDVARGLHPTNLALGYVTGKSAEEAMKYVRKYVKQPEPLEVAETGALAGAFTSTIMGTAMAPEVVGGAVGYVATKYSTEGIRAGLKAVGADDDTADGVSSTVGGGIGGFLAGASASAVAGGATGAEDGAIAGGGVFSGETAIVGGIVGSLIGLGSFIKARYL